MITFVLAQRKTMKKIGLAVILLGIILAVFNSFDFFTRRNVGGIEMTANKKQGIEWSPILGLLTAGVGVAILFADSRRESQ
jgi:hypothetical protein